MTIAEAVLDSLSIAVYAPKIDDFVQAAGISRGTFYNHFEEKETSS
jgi:AcrR family transcriptional regulator